MSTNQIKLNQEVTQSQALGASKLIKNYSMQGLTVLIMNGAACDSVWLAPKQSIRVYESQITDQARNLHKRRLINISN